MNKLNVGIGTLSKMVFYEFNKTLFETQSIDLTAKQTFTKSQDAKNSRFLE